ncbi:hypothetical protein [Kitasatospora sp. NPDC088346]|uniref:hypothetical protein n=1 Tax=Kitasatospora sp. NPDC088346 TaxID=3364073 RepID=UPI0037F9746F
MTDPGEDEGMDGSDRDGQDLREALGRAVGGAAPDLAALTAGAAAEGGAIRRRRRIATAAAVGALAAGGVLLLPHVHPSVAPATTAAAQPTRPAAGSTAAGSTAAGTVPLTGRAAVES